MSSKNNSLKIVLGLRRCEKKGKKSHSNYKEYDKCL